MEHFLSTITMPKEAIKKIINQNKQETHNKPKERRTPAYLFLFLGRQSIPCAVFYFFLFPSLASCFGLAERANC